MDDYQKTIDSFDSIKEYQIFRKMGGVTPEEAEFNKYLAYGPYYEGEVTEEMERRKLLYPISSDAMDVIRSPLDVHYYEKNFDYTPEGAQKLAESYINLAALAAGTGGVVKGGVKGSVKGVGGVADDVVKGAGNGVFGKNTVGAAEKYVPKNIKMVDSNYLKKQGIDAHALKTEFVGKKNIAHYDVYVDKDSGMLWLFRKGGVGEPTPLYEYIN